MCRRTIERFIVFELVFSKDGESKSAQRILHAGEVDSYLSEYNKFTRITGYTASVIPHELPCFKSNSNRKR